MCPLAQVELINKVSFGVSSYLMLAKVAVKKQKIVIMSC